MSTPTRKRKPSPARKSARRPAPARARTLRGLSDIRNHFINNQVPIYFVSATNFNVLGMDEWIGGLTYINYLDCFDGRHPSVIIPHEAPHEGFESIEDINNYLLGHKTVVDRVRARPGGRATFLMFDEKTEELCADLGLTVCFPSAKLRSQVDNKVSATRIGDKAGVKSVPNVLCKVSGYESLRRAARKLGDDLVVQTAFGDSGHTTFFIASEADYARHAAEIEAEPEVKVMRRIRCHGAAMEACVTRHGTVVGPLMSELVGFKELTPYRGGWCGNELAPGLFPAKVEAAARRSAFAFGEQIRKLGYRGYFELDFLIDRDDDSVYLGEVNPRLTGASCLTNLSALAASDAPLFLFHLLEFLEVPYELDVAAINKRWANPANLGTTGQLIIKHTGKEVDVVRQAPASGIWRLLPSGEVTFVRPSYHPREAHGADEAFFLRITGPGDYRYEGADLGILMVRERLMENGELNARAKAWNRGIRAHFAGGGAARHVPAPAPEAGRFKIF
jgi:biotin carboxylase